MVDAEAEFPTDILCTNYDPGNVQPIMCRTVELQEEYQAELAEAEGLTLDDLDEIAVEGSEKSWTIPERPECSPCELVGDE